MNNYTMYGYSQKKTHEMCRTSNCVMPTGHFPPEVSVAMAYVPFQSCNDVYPCEKALCMGTIFPVLNKPFLAGCCK